MASSVPRWSHLVAFAKVILSARTCFCFALKPEGLSSLLCHKKWVHYKVSATAMMALLSPTSSLHEVINGVLVLWRILLICIAEVLDRKSTWTSRPSSLVPIVKRWSYGLFRCSERIASGYLLGSANVHWTLSIWFFQVSSGQDMEAYQCMVWPADVQGRKRGDA